MNLQQSKVWPGRGPELAGEIVSAGQMAGFQCFLETKSDYIPFSPSLHYGPSLTEEGHVGNCKYNPEK